MRLRSVFAAGFIFACCAPVKASPCAEKTSTGEGLDDKGDYSGAMHVLQDAVRLCASSQERSARPFVALGVAYKNLQRYSEAIEQFKAALTQEPGLHLAYMDLGAVYLEMHQYQKSIDTSKKALGSGDPRREMQVNYNIGLSYFNLMAQTTDMTDKRSEPYFKKSAELGPQFGGSFFYLGLIKENMYGDSKAAKAYYQKACDLKYEPACRSLKTILQRTAGAPSTSAVAAVSPDDESLYDQIERAYVRKGVTEKSLSSVMTNIKAAYSQMPAAQRKTALEHMIQGLR